MRRSKSVVLAGCGSLLLSLCVGTGVIAGSGSAAAVTPRAPGTLVVSKQVTAPGVNGTAFLVEYWSEAYPSNAPVTVTGLVVVPPGTPPVGGWPVVSWAHGTNGTNGSCSPSLSPSGDVPEINNLLAQGWEVAATDYLGEGNRTLKPKPTKGILPYLVGTSAARNALDIVKAIQGSSTFSASPNYVVWGHSEGGQTAMFALDIAATYAPSLDLKGVLALAPPSNFSVLVPAAEQTANWPFLFMAVGGYQSAYGKVAAPVSAVLTNKGTKDLKLLKKGCLVSVGLTLIGQGFTTVFSFPAGSALPASWQSLVDQNDAANFSAASLGTNDSPPLVIVSGDQDNLVLPTTTNSLANELCALSPPQDLERWLYAGLDHSGIMGAPTIGDYVQWTANRFADDAAHDYTPTGSGANTATVSKTCG